MLNLPEFKVLLKEQNEYFSKNKLESSYGRWEMKTMQHNVIEFTVYGEPVAQARPRATTINGRVKMNNLKELSNLLYKN